MWDEPKTRESLLFRLKNGGSDRDWEDFYARYASVIVGFCRKRDLDEFAARDVLQETMVLLMRQLAVFNYEPAKGRFRNWLLTLVARKISDAKRRLRRSATISLDQHERIFPSALAKELAAESDSDEAMEMAWRQSLIEEAVRRLQKDLRTKPETVGVFEAYVILGKPVAEVARQFGLHENAVYQIKNRLLRRLREEVQLLEQLEIE